MILADFVELARVGGAAGLDEVLLAGAAGLAVIATGFVVIRWLKKHYHDVPPQEYGFDIDELEHMQSAGRISDEEFRLLRENALGLDIAGGKKHNSLPSPSGDVDDNTDNRGVDAP